MILAVDVGTSSLKAVLYGPEGSVLALSSRPYPHAAPQPGWAEADPEDWWQALEDAVADLRSQGLPLDRVEALALTGQMHTTVLLDREGRVIPPTILWLDRRAAAETEELQHELGLPPYQLNSTYSLPKLLWLRRHQPAVLDRVDKIVWPKDWLRFRLTGQVCTDQTEPAGGALLDWSTRTYAPERLQRVGLDESVLPPIRPAHADAGPLLPEVARSLGLSPHTRVVVGMGDVAALFGAAPPGPGRVVCSLGSSSMVFVPWEGESGDAADLPAGIYLYPFGPYPMLGGVSSTTGSSLEWACALWGAGPFDRCVAAALETEPGAAGLVFLPYLAGERSPHWSDHIRGGFFGLRLTHDARYLVRAVMEGVAYSLRHLLDLCAEAGQPAREIALAGGGATTPGWAQILADVCQCDVLTFAGRETVTRVLYALCQQHLGRGDFAESLARTFDRPGLWSPDRGLRPLYDEGYHRYRAFAGFARQAVGAALEGGPIPPPACGAIEEGSYSSPRLRGD